MRSRFLDYDLTKSIAPASITAVKAGTTLGDPQAAMRRLISMRLHLIIVALVALGMPVQTEGQQPTTEPSSSVSTQDMWYPFHFNPGYAPTRAFQLEMARLMLEEVNRVAVELKLDEKLPITRTNSAVFISFPGGYINGGELGTVDTRRYSYCLLAGRAFSKLDLNNAEARFDETKKLYTWPIERLDTNAALAAAAHILNSAGMDSAGLMRDCRCNVNVSNIGKRQFVPLYWITWFRKNPRPGALPGDNWVAHLYFVLPTMSIESLHVNDAKYVLRKPLEVTNLTELLQKTNELIYGLHSLGPPGWKPPKIGAAQAATTNHPSSGKQDTATNGLLRIEATQ